MTHTSFHTSQHTKAVLKSRIVIDTKRLYGMDDPFKKIAMKSCSDYSETKQSRVNGCRLIAHAFRAFYSPVRCASHVAAYACLHSVYAGG